jgi:hypothetical protein
MVSWEEFASAEPALAEAVRACYAVRKHCTMASLRRDGSPRISGIEVSFESDLLLGMMSGSVKARDLQRDPRVAVHSPTVDPPEKEPSGWAGEAKVAGRAEELPAAEAGGHTFRIDLAEVVLTRVGDSNDHLVVESWHPGRGVSRVKRA